MEKNAGEGLRAAAKAAKAAGKFIVKHPIGTLGTVGGLAITGAAVNAVLNASQRVLPPYVILNEERKRKTMLGQTDYLKSIADSIKKPTAAEPDPRRMPMVEPRTLLY